MGPSRSGVTDGFADQESVAELARRVAGGRAVVREGAGLRRAVPWGSEGWNTGGKEGCSGGNERLGLPPMASGGPWEGLGNGWQGQICSGKLPLAN